MSRKMIVYTAVWQSLLIAESYRCHKRDLAWFRNDNLYRCVSWFAQTVHTLLYRISYQRCWPPTSWSRTSERHTLFVFCGTGSKWTHFKRRSSPRKRSAHNFSTYLWVIYSYRHFPKHKITLTRSPYAFQKIGSKNCYKSSVFNRVGQKLGSF